MRAEPPGAWAASRPQNGRSEDLDSVPMTRLKLENEISIFFAGKIYFKARVAVGRPREG